MKKIINGKKFDTENAVLIGEISVYNKRDPKHFRECLYQKQNGDFFVAGEGNALSQYAEQCVHTRFYGGKDIIPYSQEAAKAWAERCMSVEDYEKVFGPVE